MQVKDYLIDEYPLFLLPSLAKEIGVSEAIMLQQLHYWLRKSSHHHDGRKWIYNTYKNWQDQLPFYSISTIRRTIARLEETGYIVSGNYNKLKMDKTKWYTIDYDGAGHYNNNASQQALFLRERPLVVMPTLARLTSLQEAVVLQEIYYKLNSTEYNTTTRDGKTWLKISYDQLCKTICFLTTRQLRRIIKSLVDINVIITAQLDKQRGDMTNYYAINYKKLQNMLDDQQECSPASGA